MKEIDKTKEQLVSELAQLRQQISALEAAETERTQAEEALRKSEEKYRTVVEISPEGIAIASKGHIVFVNQSLARIFGVSDLDEFVGRPIKDYIHPDYRKIVRERIEQQTKHGKVVPLIEEKMIRADGTVIHTEVAAAPLKYEGEEAVLAIIRDITERKRSEEALKESEERYKFLFEYSQTINILIGTDGKIVNINESAVESLGYKKRDILGKDVLEFVVPGQKESVSQQLIEELKGEYTPPLEVDVISTKGIRTLLFTQGHATLFEKGELTGILISAVDITERKRAEEALRESEERYRSLVDNIDRGINLIDSNHNILMVNATQSKRFNKSVNEMIGEKCFRVFRHRDAVCPNCPGVQTMTTGRPAEVETEGVRDDESRSQVRVQAFPVFGQDGMASAFIEFVEDITEHKQMEKELRQSEEKYRSLVESSEDSIYLVDSNCNYLFMNSKYLSRLGLQSSQVIGKAYGEFHSPEETKDFAQRVKKVLKTGTSLSYEYRSQRDHRYFMRTLSPIKPSEDGKTNAITVISKDVSELKQAEEALREREAFNFALFHYNPVETIVVDLDGRVIGFNQAKQQSGDRLPTIGDLMYKDYAGKHEIDMRAELMRCISSGKTKVFPERKYGDNYLSITIAPFSKGALIISEDITERKRAENLLQKERDTFFSILQKSPYGVMVIDKNGRHTFINPEFTAITGYTFEDVPTEGDWLRLAYPDRQYRNMVIETWRKDFAQGDLDEKFRKKFSRVFSKAFSVVCRDGAAKEIEFRRVEIGDGGTIAMLSDITERKRMHELMEAAATDWLTTFDAISDAVCLLDPEGRIKRCNNAILMMTGKPFSEIIGRRCWEVLHGFPEPSERCAIGRVQESYHRETEVLLRDKRWFNISIDPLLNEKGDLMGLVHIMSDITERKQVEEELHSSREQLRNLTSYLQSVREEERTNIAREIHDELAQALTALKMDLSWLANRLPREQMPLVEKTHSMSNLINATIQTVKRISAELRPGVLDDLGLVAAIEWQAEEFQHRTGIACHVTVDPEDLTVDQDRSTAIFRIFQETLTNVARHARATSVTVSLQERGATLNLMIRDNGKGIAEEQITDSKSFGLLGMRERVHPWGGEVNIKGTPGKGTTVLVSVPVGTVKS